MENHSRDPWKSILAGCFGAAAIILAWKDSDKIAEVLIHAMDACKEAAITVRQLAVC